MGCVRVRNRHLLCHSKVLRSAPFLQFSQASFLKQKFFSSKQFSCSFLKLVFLKQFSQAMPRVRSSRRAPSRSTLPSAPPASDEITEASLRALSVYDLRHRCTNAGLDNSGRKADLVACLLEHHNVVSSQPGPSTSGQPPLQRNNEDQSRLLDHTLRDTIRSEVTACVTAAVQNLLPSSSSTIISHRKRRPPSSDSRADWE